MSIKEQVVLPDEVIIADDGSKEETSSLVKEFSIVATKGRFSPIDLDLSGTFVGGGELSALLPASLVSFDPAELDEAVATDPRMLFLDQVQQSSERRIEQTFPAEESILPGVRPKMASTMSRIH